MMKRGWIPIMGVCLVLSFSACKQLLPYQDTSLTAVSDWSSDVCSSDLG